MAKQTVKSFTVTAWVRVLASTKIRAASFEEAVQVAKKLEETDFIDFKGEFCDGKPLELAWITDDEAGNR